MSLRIERGSIVSRHTRSRFLGSRTETRQQFRQAKSSSAPKSSHLVGTYLIVHFLLFPSPSSFDFSIWPPLRPPQQLRPPPFLRQPPKTRKPLFANASRVSTRSFAMTSLRIFADTICPKKPLSIIDVLVRLLFLTLVTRSYHMTEHGLQCPRRKAQPRLERR